MSAEVSESSRVVLSLSSPVILPMLTPAGVALGYLAPPLPCPPPPPPAAAFL